MTVALLWVVACSIDQGGAAQGLGPTAGDAGGADSDTGDAGGIDGAATYDAPHSGEGGGPDASYDAHVPRDSGGADVGCNQGGCPCSGGDPGTCYFQDEVCVDVGDSGNGTCIQCGQSGTNGLYCGNGCTCNQSTGHCSGGCSGD